ncbi:Putative steryl acetyl hydrolase mug81 [Leucoagaricus sp. SymC.cos]|nr:Putative steryl acetyl hydrolase mug81 [Leucoagaricus sp. SymC.cos]
MSETSPLVPRATQYGHPSTIDKIKMFVKLLPLPIILVWTLLFKSSSTKSKKRVVFNRALRYLVNSLNVQQLQWYSGTTKQVYTSWCKASKLIPEVEDIGATNLFWIAERGFDKVIVYLHGGGFLIPPSDFNLKFLYHVRNTLKGRGVNVSVVMVEYTLVPEGIFPTPLKQAVAAINHLMARGVDPQNIQFIGDSAGGNLILQVFAHMLHPLESERVPALSLPAPFKGAYLMSPWVDLSDKFKTFESGDATDILTTGLINYWGSQVLGPVPPKNLGYIEANSAAEDWWKGVDAFVDRFLISAGREECLKSEIIRFHSTFDNYHSHVKLEVHDGVHNDPMIEFGVGEHNGEMTNMIIDWLTAGFQEPTS